MIKKFLITGDTHGVNISAVKNARRMYKELKPEEIGLIILGDAGFNFGDHPIDLKWKKICNKVGVQVYCVRGNHDEHPRYMETMEVMWDKEVQGNVFYEQECPNLHYFIDGETYNICDKRTLVVGGAYSVDKEYRIKKGKFWEPHEQINREEQIKILEACSHGIFDLVLTHTCPMSWQPTDLFLSFVDQTNVDNSMEYFLEELEKSISWRVWLFAHYHEDRLIRPQVQMIYKHMTPLDHIFEGWENPNSNYHFGWQVDPNYNS